jgi:hypothetical protein
MEVPVEENRLKISKLTWVISPAKETKGQNNG